MTHRNPLRAELTRRGILKGGGALVISFTAPASIAAAATATTGRPKPLDPAQLDSYLVIHRNGSATLLFGKIDGGQGTDVGIAQIVAEELDLPADKVAVLMGDTALTVNQGGASGSFGIIWGGRAMRKVAAEARRFLLTRAAERLGAPVDKLAVNDGVISVVDQPRKKIGYGQLIGGKFFDLPLKWNGKQGVRLDFTSDAPLKKPADYKVVGTSPKRRDVTAKVFARPATYVSDIRVPGMLHARVIRPPVAGATANSVDESSIKSIPGTHVVQQGGYIAVVAEKEWNAIRAAQQLKVSWSQPAAAFVDQAQLYDHIRKAPVRERKVEKQSGAVDTALASAAKIVEADYEWPFQSHASMGSAAAVAAMKDGKMTVWTGTQKPHYAQQGVAHLLDMPLEQVHAIWVTGPGSYGRNDAGDAALEAAFLAKATGRPVRVQGMRAEGIQWDPKAPASVHHAKAGLDAAGKIVAYHFESKGFSRLEIDSNESNPAHSLIGQQWGLPLKPIELLRRARRILRSAEPPDGLGDDRSLPRSRVAAAHLASARSGRAADPFRERILHRRIGAGGESRSGRVPPAASQRPRRGGGESRGGEIRLAAARRRSHGQQQGRCRDRSRHCLCQALRHDRRRRRRGRGRSPQRQGSRQALCGRA